MIENSKKQHIPVLLNEMIKYLAPKDNEIYVDATFGAGGYSRAILQAANCKVIAIDRDPNVKPLVEELQKEFPGRLEFRQGNFADIADLIDVKIDGVVMDVGVSSMQIDNKERGFSFMKDGPLDMRMSCTGRDAKYFVNNLDEREIANIIYNYGGERKSRQIAKAIVKARDEKTIETTKELSDIVKKVISFSKEKIDPATRTFQAIRIWVNDELEQLKNILNNCEKILKPMGRLVAVTFHSLEDKIVKDFLNQKSGNIPSASRHMPFNPNETKKISFELLIKKPIKPTLEEVESNIRARSAKLRAAVKISNNIEGALI